MSMLSSIFRRSFSTNIINLSSKNAKFYPANKQCMLPNNTFEGKVAFVTGGGTGLGKSMSLMLSQLGAKVAILSRKQDILEATAEEITKQTGNVVMPITMDVRDPLSVDAAVNNCIDSLGLPNLIINNAAGNFISPTERLSPNAVKTVIDIVLLGSFNVVLNIGKKLIDANQGGSFLAISTVYTMSGTGFTVPSAAAKAGVEAMTKSLASEWAKYGLRFNCIQPGPIYTPGAFSRLDPTGEFFKNKLKTIPCGRGGETEEIANLASYLLSDYANWVTGEIVKFDGGEFNFMAGEFNELTKVPNEHWDQMESMIRKSNTK